MKKFAKLGKLFGSLALVALMFASVCPKNVFAKADSAMPKNFYNSDYDTYEELIEHGNELEKQAYAEGIVMLKNEDNALPIAEGSNISVFSKNSNSYVLYCLVINVHPLCLLIIQSLLPSVSCY